MGAHEGKSGSAMHKRSYLSKGCQAGESQARDARKSHRGDLLHSRDHIQVGSLLGLELLNIPLGDERLRAAGLDGAVGDGLPLSLPAGARQPPGAALGDCKSRCWNWLTERASASLAATTKAVLCIPARACKSLHATVRRMLPSPAMPWQSLAPCQFMLCRD